MSKFKRKNAGFLKIYVGLLFFLNPVISFVDVLPDFIGCLFLFAGLSPLLFLEGRAQEIRRNVRLIALLSVLRLILTPVFFWSAGSSDAGNTNLLLSFSFGILSLLLELNVLRALFEMYNYLSVRHNSEKALSFLEPASSAAVIFCFVKNIAAFLPDLLTIFSPESLLEYNPGSQRIQASFQFAKGLAYIGCTVFVLLFGVSVALRLRRYFKAAAAEEAFVSSIVTAAGSEEGANRGLRLRFVITGSLSLLIAMALFSFDYYIDYLSILPAPVVFGSALVLIRRLSLYRKPKAADYLICLAGLFVSGGAYAYRAIYSSDTFFNLTFADRPWTVFWGVAQGVCLFFVFWLCARAIAKATFTATQINLTPAANSATVFALINAALNAYHYILPKGAVASQLAESFSIFATLAGIILIYFTWRMESEFQKAAEWKSF